MSAVRSESPTPTTKTVPAIALTSRRNLSSFARWSCILYLQGSINDPVIVQTDWSEARCVSILDAELGVGWMSCNGHVRASAGYMFSGWMNVAKQSEFIASVQRNDYHGPDKISGNGLVFDGLVAHLEFRR
jgi:hypothetical protein